VADYDVVSPALQEVCMPHILVIEDDLEFREPLTKTLTNDGHTVSLAGDGEAALLMLKTLRPDLIITDILMPKMDGIETIMEMSRLGGTTPIIAMTGGRRSLLTSDFLLDSANLMGGKKTLSKPFSRADLRRAIQEALAKPVA
jgi:CheY-like chemotaxis protein